MDSKASILVIDDEEIIRKLFCRVFEENGYEAVSAKSEQEAYERLKEQKFQIAVLDIRMPGVNDLRVLTTIKKQFPSIEVVMVSGHGTMRIAQESLNFGAYDYLSKPVNTDDLLDVVDRVCKSLKQGAEHKPSAVRAKDEREGPVFAGKSAPIRSVIALLEKISPTSSNVLIQGETGSGKELVARYIHKNSKRGSKRFISVNCPALPDSLLESELFGHEAGAYTDASKLKRGLLEIADGGTLFLDEIGDLSAALQAKLLRVVETKIFRRLGGNEEINVDVRFLAATNKNLIDEIKAGRFRDDLYYRLGVISVTLPPLRKRREDIGLLVEDFLSNLGNKHKVLTPEAMKMLEEYDWPGNVRQLKNVIEQIIVLSDKENIGPEDLPHFIRDKRVEEPKDASGTGAHGTDSTLGSLSQMEKEHIEKVLKKTDGNQTKAAKMLGISRRTLYQKIKEYGLE